MKAPAAHLQRRIESRHNARIKELRAGLTQGAKTARNQVAIEGRHLLHEAIRSGLAVRAVFVRRGKESLLDNLALGGAEVLVVSDEVFLSAAATEHPQGIAALVDAPQSGTKEMLRGIPLVVVAAGLQDPGNLGTLVRSAEGFGASGMILLPGTASLWNAKTLRASSGSAFRLPVISLTEEDALACLRAYAVRIFAAVPSGGASDVNFCGPTALLLGNEGAGLSQTLVAGADERVTIPCPGALESLNAAVAGSVLLYEAARQRLAKDRARGQGKE